MGSKPYPNSVSPPPQQPRQLGVHPATVGSLDPLKPVSLAGESTHWDRHDPVTVSHIKQGDRKREYIECLSLIVSSTKRYTLTWGPLCHQEGQVI